MSILFPKIISPTKKGFTLLEILLVVGIIAILAGIVIVAINPSRQLKMARDLKRKTDLAEVDKAMSQFYIDHTYFPASTTLGVTLGTETPAEICDTGSGTPGEVLCDEDLVDLSELVPDYLVEIPKDPSGPYGIMAWLPFTKTALAALGLGHGTGYRTLKQSSSDTVFFEASNTELPPGPQLGDAGLVLFRGRAPSNYTIPHVGGGGY